jgi:hypothetical protein
VRGDAETVGATRGELRLTITMGWALVMLRVVPPLLGEENAVVVHVVTSGDVCATAANVKMTDSPVFMAVLLPEAVRLMALGEREEVHDAVGFCMVMGENTVNPGGMVTLVDARRLVPVSVTVTVNVTSWLAVTWGGFMAAVKV